MARCTCACLRRLKEALRMRRRLRFCIRLKIGRRRVSLARGDAASIKLVQIEGMALAAVRASLGE